MRAAVRIALRELRGGLRGFRVFVACLALGVAAIAAIGSVRVSIENGLAQEGALILGGDAEIRFTHRFAVPEERAWMEANARAVSEIVEFRSMAVHAPRSDAAAHGPEDGAAERVLVQVKGVDALYPLYGEVRLEGGGNFRAALGSGGDLPGLVAERVLVDRLGIAPGDVLRLGTQDFRLTGILELEPDAAGAGFGLGPRVIVARAALAESGLLGDGTIFESHYRMALPPGADLDRLGEAAAAAMPESGLRWRDARRAAPGIERFVERLSAFLILMGLAGLAVGGVGVASAVRAYLEGKTGTIAVLKTLGATGRTVFAVYLVQIGILALIGVGIGLAVGAAIPLVIGPAFADRLPVPVVFGVYPRPLAEAALYGLLVAAIFTIWPLARARDLRAAALFRDLAAGAPGRPRRPYLVLIGGLVALLVLVATVLAGSEGLALWAAAGVMGVLALLLAAARGVAMLARRLKRAGVANGRPWLRLAFGAVGGPTGETGSVVLSLGLGLAVLAAVGQIDWNLRQVLATELPERAPAYFLVDIQNDQRDGFLDLARSVPGVEAVETAPMLRGIVTAIKGRPAREVAGGHWVVRGDRGLSYAAAQPPGTVLTDGEWWPEDYAGPPLVSFAEEEAREIGIGVGDMISVNVLGREMAAKVANLRRVAFESLGINFVMIFDRAALAGAPHTHIATVHAGAEAEAPLLRAVGEAFPNVTAVGVRAAIDRVADALAALTAAIRWAAAVTLVTGLVVLIGAAAAGERLRTFEAAVLKTLGATRLSILGSFAARSALLGAAAGLVAIAAGALAGWGVTVFVMDTAYRFEPLSALLIVAGGAGLNLLAGLAFAIRPLRARPAQVLRVRD